MPCLLDLPRCPEIRKMQIYFSIAQQKFFELGSEKCRLILALPNKISLNLDQKNGALNTGLTVHVLYGSPAQKNNQSEHCIQYIKCSDRTIL
jgi:hypothetical protein